ncbi:hypothetical protein ACH5RR_032131 [Cinchona calisaya]|uniref:Carbohydrate kinase PfkB domain-containing protein n=1 Tax=Cinchona calisaya TaxID=153742 RepID=A0ABD2YJX0_9GENT
MPGPCFHTTPTFVCHFGEQILSIWDKTDVIKVNEVELEFLTGSNKIDDETALSLWHPNLKLLLVTLGEKGCNYYTKSFHGSIAGFHVNTVDTTGAGDSFVGALLCKIVDDQAIIEDETRLREVLTFACGYVAITTTKKGAIPALPTESDVFSLIKKDRRRMHVYYVVIVFFFFLSFFFFWCPLN